ncbi:hypothetical protein PUNSTDRAFT_64860 [Punctularia strigosozonata HHB-11173 SS5]|uniref:uncharacterized protein n=1 Tax=Punctularia strigosozonata (strain HHB-11173) TaxID=741275 RepID=UPI0004417616|nr:uncharacterized protein PUNSTDRAFT_64860 [Punctularia strigosozonata HHB-11173 SS5]EIN10148.1 hypothetical protein PUNSTDRAFT_64860 [Punctularia strigosozonata HHB-11173 SS5]
MENAYPGQRGAYIWGRSVHNVRIERLWVDVTAQVGSLWHESFTQLEISYGLDINNASHIWLLHHLFLPAINEQLTFFAEAWNHHHMQIRGGPNRSPADMFGFDMLTEGIRGQRLVVNETMADEDLEAFGVDWEALREDHVLRSLARNGRDQQEDSTTWAGQQGPPAHLNEVPLEAPDGPMTAADIIQFNAVMQSWILSSADTTIANVWVYGLAAARLIAGNVF